MTSPLSSIFVRKKSLYNSDLCPIEDFRFILRDAAKNSELFDIDFLLDSVSASKGRALDGAPATMILDVTALLNEYAMHNTRCMKAFNALDAFAYPRRNQWAISQICDDIVETINQRLNVDHVGDDKNQFETFFRDEIPDQLLGNEGIWRIIFSYHYSSVEENYKICMKGMQVMATFSDQNPSELTIAGGGECLVKTTIAFIDKPDFVKIAGEILSTLVHCNWRQRIEPAEREILIDAGVSALCMLLLNKYYDNPKITTFCFIVIHNLTECSTNELRMELTEVSVCEIIVKALKQNCLISNPKVSNINLAYHGFMAVESLIDYYHNDHAVIRGIADRFVEAGLCEVLMSILEKYLPDAVIEYDWVLDFEESDEECVLDYGQGIIRHLSFRDEPTRVRLTKLGAGNWLPELF